MVTTHGVQIPTTYEKAVELLADAHGAHHGPGTEIYRCDGGHQETDGGTSVPVRLLEINHRFPSSRKGFRPVTFGGASDFPFVSSVILASPADLDGLRAGNLALPAGWHFDPARKVWPR